MLKHSQEFIHVNNPERVDLKQAQEEIERDTSNKLCKIK